MPKLHIVGWKEGLQKISMSHVLREHLLLGLKDSKGCVDDVLAGKLVSFTLEGSATIDALAKALEEVGVIVEIEADQNSLRVGTNGEA